MFSGAARGQRLAHSQSAGCPLAGPARRRLRRACSPPALDAPQRLRVAPCATRARPARSRPPDCGLGKEKATAGSPRRVIAGQDMPDVVAVAGAAAEPGMRMACSTSTCRARLISASLGGDVLAATECDRGADRAGFELSSRLVHQPLGQFDTF